MIRNSFIFLDRIGLNMEKNILRQGVLDWNTFLSKDKIMNISDKRKAYYDLRLMEAKAHLQKDDSSYFHRILPLSETWRLYEYFRDDCVFLDIEVSSVTKNDSEVIVIGLYDGFDTKLMIRGINLDMINLSKELKNYKLIVTFNGNVFDMPFLRKRYPSLIPDMPVLDLRTACNRIGLKGGLKDIEKTLGIRRDNPIVGKLCNGDPLKLYKMFKASGDKYYLDLLVEYNEEDIINLKPIADKACKALKHEFLQSFQ